MIVSASDDGGTIRQSLDFGASGFIPKRFGVDTLRDAIMKVLGGDVWVPNDTDLSSATDPELVRLRDRLVTLTPQQVRVLMMLSEGLLNKQIAYELGVSEADHQGACVGDPAKAWRREPHASRHRRGENRRQSMAAGYAAAIGARARRRGHKSIRNLFGRHHLLDAPLAQQGA